MLQPDIVAALLPEGGKEAEALLWQRAAPQSRGRTALPSPARPAGRATRSCRLRARPQSGQNNHKRSSGMAGQLGRAAATPRNGRAAERRNTTACCGALAVLAGD